MVILQLMHAYSIKGSTHFAIKSLEYQMPWWQEYASQLLCNKTNNISMEVQYSFLRQRCLSHRGAQRRVLNNICCSYGNIDINGNDNDILVRFEDICGYHGTQVTRLTNCGLFSDRAHWVHYSGA